MPAKGFYPEVHPALSSVKLPRRLEGREDKSEVQMVRHPNAYNRRPLHFSRRDNQMALHPSFPTSPYAPMRDLTQFPQATKKKNGVKTPREGYRSIRIRDAEFKNQSLVQLVAILFDQPENRGSPRICPT